MGEPPVTFAPVSAPPRPETKPAAKCFPKKKFCKCRTTEPQVTGGTGGPSVPSGRPTPGPGTNPSGEGSTGPGTVPTGPTGPTGTIPYLLGSSTADTEIFTIPIETEIFTTSDSSPNSPDTAPNSTPQVPSLSPNTTPFTKSSSIRSTTNLGSTYTDSTTSPLSSQLPYLLTRSTGSTESMGSIPYLLTKTTPSTMSSTKFEGMMPYKLVRSSTLSTVDPNAKKQA